MESITILHTNDIHGRIEGLARIATLIRQTRAERQGARVLYFDLGDSEEPSVRLSNVTKGAAMHRLLSAAGCDAAAVGNAAAARYGPEILREHAAAARYPLLLANLRLPDRSPLPGVQPRAMLDLGPLRLGLIGVTSELGGAYERYHRLRALELAPLVQELVASLRQDGADVVVVLSHLGLRRDRELASAVSDVQLILGGHSHELLTVGEWVGEVLVAQAGEYAAHLGRIDLTWDGESLAVRAASVLPVGQEVPLAPAVLAEVEAIEAEVASTLDEVIAEVAEPLDYAVNRECRVGNLLADALREKFDADVGVATVSHFSGPLPPGPLRRGILWDACPSAGNPGLVTLSGAQLKGLVARGQDHVFSTERPPALRGRARGLVHLSGASLQGGRLLVGGQPVEDSRDYWVAGSDWEFEQYGGYTTPSWGLEPTYEVTTVLRELLEAYLAAHSPVSVPLGRLR